MRSFLRIAPNPLTCIGKRLYPMALRVRTRVERQASRRTGEHRDAWVGIARYLPELPPVEVASLAVSSPGLSTPSLFQGVGAKQSKRPDLCFTTAMSEERRQVGIRVPRGRSTADAS